MKKALVFVLSLFLALASCFNVVQAVGGPQGKNKVVCDMIWKTVKSKTECMIREGKNIYCLMGIDWASFLKVLLRDNKVSYEIMRVYYGDHQKKEIFLLSQMEEGKLKSYVCDLGMATIMNFLEYEDNLESGYLYLFMDEAEYVETVVTNQFIRAYKIEWLNQNGEILKEKKF